MRQTMLKFTYAKERVAGVVRGCHFVPVAGDTPSAVPAGGRPDSTVRPFPPKSALRVSDAPGAALARAQQALLRLDGAVAALSAPEAFALMQLRQEAIQSCRIAGARSSLADVLAPPSIEDPPDGVGEGGAARRCLRALELAISAAEDGRAGPEFLAEVHAILHGPGSGPDQARRGTPLTRDLAHFAADLDKFLTSERDLHELVRAGVAQAQFNRLRIFGDTDFRAERSVTLWMLARLQVPGAGLLPLSASLQERESDYRARIGGVTGAASWEPWLEFFLEGIAASATRAAESIQSFAALREEHRAAIANQLGHAVGRGLRVLGHLFSQPFATVADIQAITSTSYVATNQLVSRLEELGILEEVTGFRRNRQFQYGPYLRIFGADQPALPKLPRPKADRPVRRARKPTQPSAEQAVPQVRKPASHTLSDHLL